MITRLAFKIVDHFFPRRQDNFLSGDQAMYSNHAKGG